MKRGETTRSLGKAVGATSGAVTGWRNGATPRPDITRRIADYFGVAVEVLVDDARDLPADYDAPTAEETSDHLVAAPLEAAAKRANKLPGTAKERQEAFEIYLRHLRDLRAEAEKIAGGDTSVAVAVFDRMLAAWLSIEQQSPLDSEAVKEAILSGRKKGFRSASEIIHGVHPSSHEERTG